MTNIKIAAASMSRTRARSRFINAVLRRSRKLIHISATVVY